MQYAATDLYNGFNGHKPPLDMPNILYIIMSVGIVMKFLLWVYCLRLNVKLNSDTVGTSQLIICVMSCFQVEETTLAVSMCFFNCQLAPDMGSSIAFELPRNSQCSV
jgi:hypothetical protein